MDKMQSATSKFKTGFLKLGNDGIWLPVSSSMISELGFELESLLKMDFELSIVEGRLRIEAVPSKNAASIHHNSEQGAVST